MAAAYPVVLSLQVDDALFEFGFNGSTWTASGTRKGLRYVAAEVRFVPLTTPTVQQVRALLKCRCEMLCLAQIISLSWFIDVIGQDVVVHLVHESVHTDSDSGDFLSPLARLHEELRKNSVALRDAPEEVKSQPVARDAEVKSQPAAVSYRPKSYPCTWICMEVENFEFHDFLRKNFLLGRFRSTDERQVTILIPDAARTAAIKKLDGDDKAVMTAILSLVLPDKIMSLRDLAPSFMTEAGYHISVIAVSQSKATLANGCTITKIASRIRDNRFGAFHLSGTASLTEGKGITGSKPKRR